MDIARIEASLLTSPVTLEKTQFLTLSGSLSLTILGKEERSGRHIVTVLLHRIIGFGL